jgi:hypothetical protein
MTYSPGILRRLSVFSRPTPTKTLNIFVLPVQDPYFPHGVVDLRYTVSCEIIDSKSFRLRTSQKTVRLGTDSTTNRDEWIKAIRKVVFKAQNQGDSVKVRTTGMTFGC